METIRKIIPFEIWQSEWLLRWLHEQSREGWELENISGNVATFKPTTHINLVYGLFSFASNTKEDMSQLKKMGPYLRKQMLQVEYEADGWSCVTEWQDLFVMQRTRFDAVPPPPIPDELTKQRKQSRSKTLGVTFTLLLLMGNLWMNHDTYPHILWLVFMGLMALAFAGGLLYLPHVLGKQKDDVRPRDVSQEDYHHHLQHAKALFLLKSAVFAGNIIGLLAQLVDISARIFS